jgi:hypothetical protein
VKSAPKLFHKRDYLVYLFLCLYAVIRPVHAGVFIVDYFGTQGIEFRPLCLGEIPSDKVGMFGECGNEGTISFLSSLPSPRNKFDAANLITPARQKSQVSPAAVIHSGSPLVVDSKPVREKDGQNSTKAGDADSGDGIKNWLGHIWRRLLMALIYGFIGGMVALNAPRIFKGKAAF